MDNVIKRLLFGEKNCNIIRRSYFLNIIAGLINALQAVFIQMLIIRVTGIKDAGIMTIAMAISNLVVTVGKFGVRNYQVTDLVRSFSFKTYLITRFISTIAMMMLSMCYIVYEYYFLSTSVNKLFIIFVTCAIYAVDALEDVFLGEFQLEGRLDVSSVVYIVRWSATILVFGMGLIISHNLLMSVLITFFFTGSFSLLINGYISKEFAVFDEEKNKGEGKWLQLLLQCAPLFAGAFFMMYLTNSPKYAIERYLSDEVQACFGFVSMPIFAIELLNNFLYQPKLVKMAIAWDGGKLGEFKKYIVIQCTMLVGLTIICIMGADIFGIPILSLLYNVNLIEYRRVLLVLLLGGGFLALVGFYAVLLTIMRKQTWMMYAYIVDSFLALIVMNPSVRYGGVWGGTVAFVILMAILALLLLLSVITVYYARKRKIQKNK